MARRNVPSLISAATALLNIVVNLVTALKKKGANIGEAFYHLSTEAGKQAIEEIAAIMARGLAWKTLVSDGRDALALIAGIEAKGRQVTGWAKDVMSKPEFAAGITNAVTYKLVAIRGEEFEDKDRTNQNIRALAEQRHYRKPPAFLAALAREQWNQDEVGVELAVFMHEPILDSDSRPDLLVLDRDARGEYLRAYYGRPGDTWGRELVFVFLAPQDGQA